MKFRTMHARRSKRCPWGTCLALGCLGLLAVVGCSDSPGAVADGGVDAAAVDAASTVDAAVDAPAVPQAMTVEFPLSEGLPFVFQDAAGNNVVEGTFATGGIATCADCPNGTVFTGVWQPPEGVGSPTPSLVTIFDLEPGDAVLFELPEDTCVTTGIASTLQIGSPVAVPGAVKHWATTGGISRLLTPEQTLSANLSINLCQLTPSGKVTVVARGFDDNDDLVAQSMVANVDPVVGTTLVDLPPWETAISTYPGPDLSGLENLRCLGSLRAISNDALTSLSGLDAVTAIGGYLWVSENTALTSLTGLDAVGSVGGFLIVEGNGALTSVAGLDAVTSIGSYLRIRNNAALTSLTGLGAVTSIGGYLDIDSNTALTSLGLSALDEVLGSVFDIIDNSQLPQCEAQELYDGVTTKPTEAGTFDVTTGNTGSGMCP